ncbi:MAG: ABC transporter six-transmembrane domain-containing protein, partial [Bacteroidota bacterium]
MEVITSKNSPVVAAHRTAQKVLRDITKAYPHKLSLTGGLVIVENALELFYPVVAGVALDAVLRGDLPTAFSMVAIIFSFWLIGATRRALDTRIYTKIYQDLVGKVIVNERKRGLATSAIIVHASLARQFVDFFEVQVPALATALVSVVGAVIMLFILAPLIGILSLFVLLISIFTGFRFLKKSEIIA